MTPSQNPAEPKTDSIVPPRGNLGPEPWPESSKWPVASGWAGFSIGLVLILLGLWARQRRRSAKNRSVSLNSTALGDEFEPSPRDRLIATSEQVREALIRAFGSAWGSKTTEEIGQGHALIERLEPDDVARLMDFLKLADRAKFAEGEPDSVEDWATWSSGIVARLSSPQSNKSGSPARS